MALDEETSKKVIRQVEFYFSDSNLPRDNFLRNLVTESEDGMVSLALICSFARMRTHLSLGDVKADGVPEDTVKSVAETLGSSDFLKLSEDGTKVGRKTELAKPEEVIEQLDSRTLAASPLPYDVKLEDVESFFGQFAKVNSVRLPPHVSNKKIFCGSALVEFSAEEDLEKVLSKTLEFAGVTLELKPKKDFDAERESQQQQYDQQHGHAKRKGSEEAYYPKGLVVAFSLKSKSSGGDSKQNGTDEPASEADASDTNGGKSPEEADKASESDKNGADANMEEPKEEQETPNDEGKEAEDGEKSSEGSDEKDTKKPSPKGKSAGETYKDNNDVITREDLKPVFQKFGTVKWIDFSIGEQSGYVRFEDPEAAQKARAAAVLTEDGGLVVKNYIATLEPVTGEAEKEYWSRMLESQQARFKDKGHRGRGGKHNRGGRHGRSRDHSSHAGRPNKVQKVAT